MHHFHEVAGSPFPYPVAAGSAVRNLGADALENGLHERPCRRRATGHHARAVQGTLLAAGNSGADVEQALALDVSGTPGGIGEMGVAAVDDDIALVQEGNEFLDEVIHRLPRLYH